MTPQIDIREKLDLYCGLRPIHLYHELHTPLKKYRAGEIDFLIIRESTEGLFSTRLLTHSPDANEVTDTLRITRHGSERLREKRLGDQLLLLEIRIEQHCQIAYEDAP